MICDFRIHFLFHRRGTRHTYTLDINRALQTIWFWGNTCTTLDKLFSKYRDIEQLLQTQVETGDIVQVRNKGLGVELRLYWNYSPSSDCLSCSIQDLNCFDTCSHIIFLYCEQVYLCIWMQISLHFEEFLCKNLFFCCFCTSVTLLMKGTELHVHVYM